MLRRGAPPSGPQWRSNGHRWWNNQSHVVWRNAHRRNAADPRRAAQVRGHLAPLRAASLLTEPLSEARMKTDRRMLMSTKVATKFARFAVAITAGVTMVITASGTLAAGGKTNNGAPSTTA